MVKIKNVEGMVVWEGELPKGLYLEHLGFRRRFLRNGYNFRHAMLNGSKRNELLKKEYSTEMWELVRSYYLFGEHRVLTLHCTRNMIGVFGIKDITGKRTTCSFLLDADIAMKLAFRTINEPMTKNNFRTWWDTDYRKCPIRKIKECDLNE